MERTFNDKTLQCDRKYKIQRKSRGHRQRDKGGALHGSEISNSRVGSKTNRKLNDEILLAIGMKVMVLLNLATEADIANGTRGKIKEIILDDREDEHNKAVEEHLKLQYPPALILFKPDKGTSIKFEGIEEGLILITPSAAWFTAKRKGEESKTYKIRRRQYAITPGYAFTDYKSQGQTIENVIIDIGKPPSGKLSPFGTCVSLSRSRGRDTIRLLHQEKKEGHIETYEYPKCITDGCRRSE